MAGSPDGHRHDSQRPSLLALNAGLGLLLAAMLPLVLALSPTVQADDVSIRLYGSALEGWSTTPGDETNPGPTFQVDQGDRVTVTLTNEGLLEEHGLFIDYNNNGELDGTDFVSDTTSTTITFSFDAVVAGTFTYYCPIHSELFLGGYDPDSSPMRGTWITRPGANDPPSATIRSPIASTSWTGGSVHDIEFDVTDPNGDALTVTLEYSYGGGPMRPIAGPLTPGPNPNEVAWTPTGFSATDTVVHLTVRDALGASTTVNSPPFEVDSIAPQIAATAPPAGAAGVSLNSGISVTWSERMNTQAAGGAGTFGVRIEGGSWIGGTVSWSADGRRMTFTPGNSLSPATAYEAHVNSTARDDSNPGMAFNGPAVWTFTTSSTPDTTAPTVESVSATPPVQDPDAPVNITANVQDDIGIGGVSADIVGPSFEANLTMSLASGATWFVERSYGTPGTYAVTVWATDTAGNLASRSGGFTISAGSVPPGDLPAPASVSTSVTEDGSVLLTWNPVTAPGLIGYHVHRGDEPGGPYLRLTTDPVPPSSTPSYIDRTIEPGQTYYFVTTSVNSTGMESAYSQEASMSVPAFRNPPIFDPVPWAVAVTTMGVIVGAIYGFVWRRKPA